MGLNADTLEDGYDALEELEWELGGLAIEVGQDGDDGLDDIAEVEADASDAAGDGDAASEQRLASRPITLTVRLVPGDGEVSDADHALFAAAVKALRTVMSPLPDRSATRLLRWRRIGEEPKRIAVKPAPGRSMVVPGDLERLSFAAARKIDLRLVAPDPVILSDALHSYTFAAGETATIINAGSLCAVNPGAWSLSSAAPVTIQNLDFSESVRFPVGPVTVSRSREIVATNAYGVCYGPGSSLIPRWPLLRPGENTIKASAACTLFWRDTD